MILFGKKGMWEFVYSLVQNFATNYILLLKLVYIMLENTLEVVKRASFLSENKISLSRLPENLRTSFYKTSGIHGPFTQLIRDSAFEAKTPSNTSRQNGLLSERRRTARRCMMPRDPGFLGMEVVAQVKNIHQLCGQCPNLKIFS